MLQHAIVPTLARKRCMHATTVRIPTPWAEAATPCCGPTSEKGGGGGGGAVTKTRSFIRKDLGCGGWWRLYDDGG